MRLVIVFLYEKKGFTLIELLVIVAIIGIISVIGVVAYSGYTSSVKSTLTRHNHKLVAEEVELTILNCKLEGKVQLMSVIRK